MGIVLVLVLIPQLLLSQCANFGAFDIGEDVEITCADSCLTLVSPSIATVASGGAEYEVEEIEYALPYPFNRHQYGGRRVQFNHTVGLYVRILR